ncbi:alkanesulfonate transporter permease subunit [Bacillus sp. AFS076308]|uniref:ABC transporter permease subunit n=1 Tax=unclassified Bacillus (in: firmicutes) TaxID=185979 RepID=UPI000BF48E46|nr:MULTISPECIES: ABC transporter permease subunit [unclassified Bacillus (in: firmicutes)]PFO01391.1 alkanesulfonate transporter permease subunit [Bacillus sp. AFS076308]PGV52234.1 alkanesulfonate transporter permease subunit [Bacillus sp. AFS037270]
MRKISLNTYMKFIAPWILPALMILFWQVFTSAGLIAKDTLPSPTDILDSAFRIIGTGELFTHIQVSFSRAFSGFLIGGGLGLILGVVNGVFPIAERHVDTTIQMFRNIPHLALIPLVILWLGIGEEAKIFLVSIGVFFPIYVNTYYGIITVDKGLIEMGKVYGLPRSKLLIRVIFKGALPSVLVGVRYALGIMWLTLIVAETVAADSGIGYMAMHAREFMQIDVVIVAILLYAVLGKLADSAARLLESRLLKWNPSYNKS